MKQCYYCNNSIPDDASICPMCGMDVKEDPNVRASEVKNYQLNSKKYSRKEENRLNVRKGFQSLSRYVSHLAGHIAHPQEYPEQPLPTLYGVITFVLSALLSAGTVTRVVGAWDFSYQTLSKISILPILSFTYNGMEWFIKATVFFFISYSLYGILAYLFKRNAVKESLTPGNWLTHFSAMNVVYSLLLLVAFLLALISPLGLGIPALLTVVIHLLSYLVAFLSTLDGTDPDKKYYQGSLAAALHFLVMMAVGYMLLNL